MSLSAVAQSSTPGEIVSLYRLDTTRVGGGIYYFATGSLDGSPIVFGGVSYTPFDVEFTGLETNAGGAAPQPKMKVSNTNGVFQTILNTYGDLLGCSLIRVRTFKRFLDGQPSADPTAYFGPDAYKIERKVDANPMTIEWELASSLDQEGKLIPGRVVIRDTCLWRYRQYNAGTDEFDYTRAQCPYTGGAMFDALDQVVTDKADDACSRHLSGCRARFGNAPLPFGGFPGAARVRG